MLLPFGVTGGQQEDAQMEGRKEGGGGGGGGGGDGARKVHSALWAFAFLPNARIFFMSML